jgi:hypothetical protein
MIASYNIMQSGAMSGILKSKFLVLDPAGNNCHTGAWTDIVAFEIFCILPIHCTYLPIKSAHIGSMYSRRDFYLPTNLDNFSHSSFYFYQRNF